MLIKFKITETIFLRIGVNFGVTFIMLEFIKMNKWSFRKTENLNQSFFFSLLSRPERLEIVFRGCSRRADNKSIPEMKFFLRLSFSFRNFHSRRKLWKRQWSISCHKLINDCKQLQRRKGKGSQNRFSTHLNLNFLITECLMAFLGRFFSKINFRQGSRKMLNEFGL